MKSESINLQRDRLFEALASLEQAVESPCVPGELERWIDGVDVAFKRLRPMVKEQIVRVHPQQFAEIRDEDEEMHRRVELMRQEDATLREAFEQLDRDIAGLKRSAENLEPDEARLRDAFGAFVQETIDCIVRTRTQEEAIRTWMMEAFTRDRGAVD